MDELQLLSRQQPGPEEAVRRFADFAGDSVLVGHNIKQSDLHYIDAAAGPGATLGPTPCCTESSGSWGKAPQMK